MKYKAIFTSLVFLLPRNLDHQKPGPTEVQKFSTTCFETGISSELDGDNHFSRNEIVGFGM